jgi:translation elongation factor EF-Tu-like GTPase
MKVSIHVDLLEPGAPITVLARLSVLATEISGRKIPIISKYQPNHNFGDANNNYFYIGRIEVSQNDWVYPGQTREVRIEFLNGPGLSEKLKLGCQWRIQEGPRLIATAEFLSVVTS